MERKIGHHFPNFKDLVALYGSPFKAVRYLHSTLEWDSFKISDYSKLPYHIVELYLHGEVIKSSYKFIDIVEFYKRLAVQRSHKAKVKILKEMMHALISAQIPLEVGLRFLTGELVDTKLGISKTRSSILLKVLSITYVKFEKDIFKLFMDYGDYSEIAHFLTTPEKNPSLTVEEIYKSIKLLARMYLEKTFDSKRRRMGICSSILQQSTPNEARFFIRLLLKDLRLMYSINTVSEVVSDQYHLDFNTLIAAQAMINPINAMIRGIRGGNTELLKIKMVPGMFIRPMLAQLYTREKVVYPVIAEIKWDGSRIQIHKNEEKILLFSRRGIEKSAVLPEIVNIAKKFESNNCIVDAEVLSIDLEGKIQPWDRMLKRTVQKIFKPTLVNDEPVTIKAFDILFLNDNPLIHLPLIERKAILDKIIPEEYITKSIYCESEGEVQEIFESVTEENHEGIIIKSANSKYSPNFRSDAWLKLKKWGDTIDAVIVKAKYGKGKLGGLFGSFVIAVRDPNPSIKKLYVIGRVGNLPRDQLQQLTNYLLSLEISRDADGVLVKPKLVVEVTYIEVLKTTDPVFTSGFALRNPVIIRIRNDKTVNQVDDLNRIKELHRRGRIQKI